MRTVKRQRGQGLIEYALLILLLIGFLGGGVIVAKDPILSLFSSINGPVAGATPTPGPGNNPTPPPDGSTPTGHATDVIFSGGTSYVSGTHWTPNATVIVSWSSGPWAGMQAGLFTVGDDGSNGGYYPMWVNAMDVGSYGLLFTSGSQTATTTLNVLDSTPPLGYATDTRVGGQTNISGYDWAANATVTVTYASGPDNGLTLGTFTVNYQGQQSDIPMTVDPALSAGLYNLSFVSGAQSAVTTFFIQDPQGYATDTRVGGTTNVSGYFWLSDSNVTVTYASGLHSGQVLGTFTVGADGNSATSTPMTVAADLPAGNYDLNFTSGTQNATATLSIWDPEGNTSPSGPGGATDVTGFYWLPNAEVTVTYTDGPDSGTVLGTFTVNANGDSDTPVTMPVAADLLPDTSYNLSFTAGTQSATGTLDILAPMGSADGTVAGGYTYLYGQNWPSDATVTVTYTSGADLGQVLGTFTVDVYGNDANTSQGLVDPWLSPGTYDLSFDSGVQHAIGTIDVFARPDPVGYAGDSHMGGEINVGGHYWPANATVTVAYSEGDLMGHILGTFTVDAIGDSSGDDFLSVDPSLSLGEHGLSFASGGQTAAATFNIYTPTCAASDAHVGGNTEISYCQNWAIGDLVTVTYASGADNGATLGTVDLPQGYQYYGGPVTLLAVDPGLDPGAYDLRFTSSWGQSIIVPFNILSTPLAITVTTQTYGDGPLCQGDSFPANGNGTIYIAGTQIGTWTADANGHLTCVIMISEPATPEAYADIPGASTCTFKTTVNGHSYDLASPSCNPQSYLVFRAYQMVAISADDLAACGEKGTAVGMPFGECSEGYVAASQNCVQDWWKGCPITMFSNGEFTWADGNTHHAVPGMVISAWTGMGANTVTTDQGRALIVVGPTPYYWNGTITQYDIQGGVWTWNWDHSTSVTRPAGLGPETLGP